MLLKAAIPFDCTSPQYLSLHKKRKNRVSRANPAHMNSPQVIDIAVNASKLTAPVMGNIDKIYDERTHNQL